MSSGATSGDGSVYELLRRCSILAGSGWTLIRAPSSTLIAQEAPAAPARSPLRPAPPASKSESIRLQTPLNGLSERRHRSGPKPDAGSCTSLGARIDLVDDSRAYPTCPGRKSMCALSLTCTCEQKSLRAIPSQRIGFG